MITIYLFLDPLQNFGNLQSSYRVDNIFFKYKKGPSTSIFDCFQEQTEIFIKIILPNISMDDKFRLLNPREMESKQHSFCASFPQLLYSSSVHHSFTFPFEHHSFTFPFEHQSSQVLIQTALFSVLMRATSDIRLIFCSLNY